MELEWRLSIIKESPVILYLVACFSSPYPAILPLFHPPPTMDELDATPLIFDPNSQMTTNQFLFLYGCWALLDLGSHPLDILSRMKVKTIGHHKSLAAPEHEYLVIDTVDPSNKSFKFILDRRPANTTTDSTPAVDDQISYRTRLTNKLRKLINTLTRFIVPNESVDSSSLAFTSLSIEDKGTLALVQTSDLVSESLEKSGCETPAIDRFLGQNHLSLSHYHGQVTAYCQPRELSLFQLVVLSNVVHDLYPTYTVLDTQCFFYAQVVYRATKKIFGTVPLQSADESQGLVDNIDSHHAEDFKFGHYKGCLVSLVPPEILSQVESTYAGTYPQEVTKVSFINL
jgi:hypothetical protein